MLVSGFNPQGDMGATGLMGAPGPKGEKGDSVSKALLWPWPDPRSDVGDSGLHCSPLRSCR